MHLILPVIVYNWPFLAYVYSALKCVIFTFNSFISFQRLYVAFHGVVFILLCIQLLAWPRRGSAD